MSLVERYAANFIPNRVTFRERSAFRGLFIRKISLILCAFDCVCVCVCVSCVITKCKTARSIFNVFYFFIIEKVRMMFKQEKNVTRNLWRNSVLTIDQCKNYFSKFRFDN